MRWRAWPDSLLLRLVLAQVLVITAAFGVMLLFVGQQRGAAAARTIAPLWAEVLQRALASPAAAPQDPGGSRARAARYGVLREELAERGLVIGEIRISRQRGRETTWLELQAPGAAPRWVAFDGGVFGPDEAAPRWPVLLLVLALVLAASTALTWTIVRPLTRLRLAIERFRATGVVPAESDTAAPSPGGLPELRLVEQSFAAMARERAQLDHDRTLMLAGISHDLRSPLARIRLHAELLPEADPALAASKHDIQRNVDLADRHLAAFLDFAAPISPEEWRELPLAMLWRDAARLALPDPLTLVVETAPPPDAAIHSCARLIVRTLAVALENAAKHGRAPITARTQREGDAWLFEVEDGGDGIPAADRERVLRAFERGERGRTTPGTGLGLALAVQMAARLGAHVQLDQASRGLVFRLRMPAAPRR